MDIINNKNNVKANISNSGQPPYKSRYYRKRFNSRTLTEDQIKECLESTDSRQQLVGLQRVQLPEQVSLYSYVVKIAVQGRYPETSLLAKKRLKYFKEHATNLLLEYLKCEDQFHRIRAIQLLGFLRDASVVPYLIAHAKNASKPEICQILVTLGSLRDCSAHPFISSYIDDPDPKLRVPAVTALGSIQDELAFEELNRKLSDPSPQVKYGAMVALERFKDPSIASRLEPLLEDEDFKIRTQAMNLKKKCAQWLREADKMVLGKTEERAIIGLVNDVETIFKNLKQAPENPNPVTEVIPFSQYNTLLKQHTAQFRVEFERYFRKFKDPISAFDTELFYRFPILYMGLTLRSPSDIESFGAVVPSFQGIKISSKILQKHLIDKLKSLDTLVTAHGVNDVERKSLYQAGVRFIDTGQIVKKMRSTDKKNFRSLCTSGLGQFEKVVHFKRHACCFWKHKISEEALLAQMIHAIQIGMTSHEYRVCLICANPQDHFLYCLEDAFISLLIFAYVKNRFTIEPRGGSFKRNFNQNKRRF